MNVTDDELSAFADGMLGPFETIRIAGAVEGDAALAARVDRMRLQAETLKAAFGNLAETAPPEHLVERIRGAGPARGWRAPFHPREGLIAASAALAAMVLSSLGGQTGDAPQRDEMYVGTAGGLQASGHLASALDARASGAPAEDGVAIVFSLPAQSGGYCRAFTIGHGESPVSVGLACNDDDAWAVVALAQTPKRGDGAGYSLASGALPELILEAAAARRFGDPLDADAEARAIAARWVQPMR